MSLIVDNLIVASFEESFDEDLLASHKVTHVLNVASECEVCNEGRQNLIYAKHAIGDDDADASMIDILSACMSFLDGANVTIVHCLEGKSRSVCVVLAYMCLRLGWQWDDALAHVRGVRPCISPFPKYLRETRAFVEVSLYGFKTKVLA